MSNLIVTSPQRPYTFPDKFKAVSNGDVYAGIVDKTDLENPANQIQVYVVGEDGHETPVSQPLKINSGGLLVYNGQPSKFVVKQNYSMLVKQRGKQVMYEPNMAFVDPESLIFEFNVGDSIVVDGKIYPSKNETAKNGNAVDNVTHLKVSGGDFDDLTLLKLTAKDGSKSPASGVISNIKKTAPYEVTIGGVSYWMQINKNSLFVESFGLKEDDLSHAGENAQCINAAWSVGVFRFLGGKYYFDGVLEINTSYFIEGAKAASRNDKDTTISTRLICTGNQDKLIHVPQKSDFDLLPFSRISRLSLESNESVQNQHAIVFSNSAMKTEFESISFNNITGYCIAFDGESRSYGESISITNCSAYNVGGVMGYYKMPISNNYLAVTLLRISNWNLGTGINSTSPQETIWDWRGVREVSGDNFLNQGAGNSATKNVIRVGSNSYIDIRGVHSEWTTDEPDNFMVFDDEDPLWFGDAESIVTLSSGQLNQKFKFIDNTEARLRLIDFGSYGNEFSDIFEFTGRGGFVEVVNWRSKNVLQIPENLKSRVKYSGYSLDVLTPSLEGGFPTPMYSWRGSDGKVSEYDTAYADGFKNSSVVEETVISEGRFKVQRSRRSNNSAAIGAACVIPTEWVGEYFTGVIRWRVTADNASQDSQWRINASGDVDTNNTTLRVDGFGKINDPYRTSIVTFKSNGENFNVNVGLITGVITGNCDLFIMSIDVYKGTSYMEPHNLPK